VEKFAFTAPETPWNCGVVTVGSGRPLLAMPVAVVVVSALTVMTDSETPKIRTTPA
jgi:hypothetical protein